MGQTVNIRGWVDQLSDATTLTMKAMDKATDNM